MQGILKWCGRSDPVRQVTAALGKEGIVRLEVNVDHPEPWKEKMDWAFVERWCTPYTHKPEHKDIERAPSTADFLVAHLI